jgi:DNA polymerase-1
VRLVFDLETNGLLDRPDLRVLCGAAIDVDTGQEWTSDDLAIDQFVGVLQQADELIGHNIAGFDIRVLERLHGFKCPRRFYDTLLVSRSRYHSDMLERTARYRNGGGRTEAERELVFPRKHLNPKGIHGLKAWGYRLGYKKGELLEREGAQESYSDELLDYCLRDVRLTVKVWQRLQKPDPEGRPAPPYEAMIVESFVGYVLEQQKEHGVGFDREAAEALQAELASRREVLARELRSKYFPDWYGPKLTKGDHLPGLPTREGDAPYRVPKRSYKVVHPHPFAGITAGCPFTPIELKEFNPGSRQQIAERLQKLYGWEPKEFTNEGLPKVSEQILEDLLDIPAVPLLIEYLTVEKRLGQLAEGDASWLKNIGPDGRIHGTVLPTGARTGRASHQKPNTGNVPKVKKYPKGHEKAGQIIMGLEGGYGAECRALFRPTRPDLRMVGVDASGLQLRCLAHRLAAYDGGNYVKVLLEGDPHEAWRQATGLFMRENQKTDTYAFLFGARDPKLGTIVLADWREAFAAGITDRKPPPLSSVRGLGEANRSALLTRVPGLEELMKACERAFRSGYVIGLDGRIIKTKTAHGVLNDVLQGDEAVIMKHAIVLFREYAGRAGLVLGRDYAHLLFVHDEKQFEAVPECAHTVGTLFVQAIKDAGEKLGFRCPLDGEFRIGSNWQETH